MIFFFGASLLLSLITGVLMTLIFFPSGNRKTAGILLRLFAGGGLGIGVTSCSYFVCLLAGLTRYVALIDLAVCLVFGLIWNMHARFLFRGGDLWRGAFASGLDWSHWDYPLLLPLSIARGWTYTGGEGIVIPAAMGFVFTLLILGIIVAALSLLRGRTQGCLAAMILMGTPFFIAMGASQFADIPFAFFVYVMTPLDLNWHLMTSLNRLFLQLWPSAVFLAFMAAAIPGAISPAGGRPEAASPKVKQVPVKGKTARK